MIRGEDGSMSNPRDTIKYHVKIGNRVVDGGITNDRERREKERQREIPGSHLAQVGRRTTKEAGREWEKRNGFA
jgi:hypothetical protein